ncbi:GTP pyrophosphokinase [Salsuginibacillus kocurii]|uniref:GTP pyrophosphokinase n=1 Tax=Salsuginibacillus kocurii TaxID=427078 RepID=UPI000376AB98|nr:GTP pyrophosphokinase family protein [Salsuginibacillus kocurii]
MELKRTVDFKKLKSIKAELTRFLMTYKFALDEVNTKIDILKQEFEYVHDYSPIEHVKSRVKSPESIIRKIYKKGYTPTLPAIKENIVDIAGIRITCSFLSDIYKLSEMLESQKDIKVLDIKDYIKHPKANGYQSLHLIVEVPVFMSDREEHICVEVQIRTIAMDFWASLEHKIYYKFNKEVPERVLADLKEAAETATQLDKKMERLHKEMNELKTDVHGDDEWYELLINNERFMLPQGFIEPSLDEDKRTNE